MWERQAAVAYLGAMGGLAAAVTLGPVMVAVALALAALVMLLRAVALSPNSASNSTHRRQTRQ